MQLMWVAGPTGDVRTISITARKVLIGSLALAASLVATGFLLYLIGFKIAIEVRPELARSLGGVTTEAEQQRMESVYRERLTKLQNMLDSTAQDILQLQQLKNRFMEIATPTSLRNKSTGKDGAKGGPLIPNGLDVAGGNESLVMAIDGAMDNFRQLNMAVGQMRSDWARELAWLQTLPIGLPIQGDFRISSGFGMRTDPFTGALARHEGLDFTAAAGTPIVAAANGVVTRSGWEDSYGNIIEVTHAEGFMTRYAHLSKRYAVEGQTVVRGQRIADVGSTGRSTGPHLHYEIFRHGRILNPVQVLPLSES